jgi:3-oxoacyl-[acyl-carrier protein] reductase
MNISLENKNALICGSTQGIGWATACELASQGASCILMARNEDTLKACITKLPTPLSQKHSYVVADFADNNMVKNAINEVVKNTTIHILINNTGGPPSGAIALAETEAFQSAFQLHLINNHILTSAVIDGMKKDNYGRIVNVISTSVKIPLANLGVSNTIRGAVASWAKTWANEIASFGITVNNVLPGATATGRLSSIIETKASKLNTEIQDVEKEMLHEIPMKRFGEPSEIANMITFLASPAASYVTGQSICVDGGRTGSI